MEIIREYVSRYQSVLARQSRVWNQEISTFIPSNRKTVYLEKFVQAVLSAKAAPAADPLDITRQLDDMRADARRATPGLIWLAERFSAYYPDSLPRPYLRPTPESRVQAEWTLGAYDASMEIDLDARSAQWRCLARHTGQSDERRLNLKRASAWKWLAGEVQRLGSDTDASRAVTETMLSGENVGRRFTSQADLRKFFEYAHWLAGPGQEPDWEEHLQILEESQLKGVIES